MIEALWLGVATFREANGPPKFGELVKIAKDILLLEAKPGFLLGGLFILEYLAGIVAEIGSGGLTI